MEDFLAVVALIVYFVAAASGKKKKAKKKQQKQAARRNRDVVFDHAFDHEMEQPAPASTNWQAAKADKPEECTQQRLHLHDVTQAELHAADEGEDPCHAGQAAAFDVQMDDGFAQEETSDRGDAVQDILRGVIMSEVLTRPCDRAALRRNRRSAV